MKEAEIKLNLQKKGKKILSETKKLQKKKPTGILKDLSELKRYSVFPSSKVIEGNKNGNIVRWSDVEAIINKYLNP